MVCQPSTSSNVDSTISISRFCPGGMPERCTGGRVGSPVGRFRELFFFELGEVLEFFWFLNPGSFEKNLGILDFSSPFFECYSFDVV